MARIKMVTRTVTQTTAEVMSINTTTCEIKVQEVTLGGTYEDGEDFLKACINNLELPSEIKFVKAENLKEEQLLLGMTEEDFIRNASVLPPRAKSEVENEE